MPFFPKVAEVRQPEAVPAAGPIERDEASGILPGERGTPVGRRR